MQLLASAQRRVSSLRCRGSIRTSSTSRFGPAGSNDDHPPSDLSAGQKLALTLFHAVAQSPLWEKTIVIITYDEHGGFYDHVPPPAARTTRRSFHSLGPRVPAFVVSPLVGAGSVSTTVFDHTSIIKTILARFCRRADGTVPDMGARVRAAQHLGGVLTEPSPRQAIPRSSYQTLIAQAQGWGDKLAAHAAIPTRATLQAEASVTDFQQEFLSLRQAVLARRSPGLAAPPPSPSAEPQPLLLLAAATPTTSSRTRRRGNDG